MAHLTAALAAPDVSLPLLVVAAAQFALFAGADMTLLMHVWRAHNQHQHQQLRTQHTQRLGQAFGQQFDSQHNNDNNMQGGRLGSRMSLLSLPLLAETAMQQWQLQAQRVRSFISGDDDSDSSSSSRASRGRFQSAANAAVEAAAAAVVQLATGRSLLLLYVRFYLVLLLGEQLPRLNVVITLLLSNRLTAMRDASHTLAVALSHLWCHKHTEQHNLLCWHACHLYLVTAMLNRTTSLPGGCCSTTMAELFL
jgi:hypothetical protein